MAARWIELVTGSFDDKKRWRAYTARKKDLPAGYRTATDGLERYLMYAGAVAKGDVLVRMLEDLADLMEGAAADGIPIRDIVGEDPVEFAETFLRNYEDGQWVSTERARLVQAMEKAESDSEDAR